MSRALEDVPAAEAAKCRYELVLHLIFRGRTSCVSGREPEARGGAYAAPVPRVKRTLHAIVGHLFVTTLDIRK